jgi:rhamnulokinase
MGNYLAIDIGISGGRHILGNLKNGKLVTEEIHRFENDTVEKDGEQCWDLDNIFKEVKFGIKKCLEIGKLPIFVGIDAWGMDFVLLDHEDKIIGNTKHSYNTIDQLIAMKKKYPDDIKKAESLLMIPDYFNYLLSGVKRCEYTSAITTKLVNPVIKEWDVELIEMLGYPHNIFPEISRQGTILGNLTRELTEEIGYDCIIVQPATNDNSSADLAIPSKKQNSLNTEPIEAAAIGNILVLMMCSHELKDLQTARECVRDSFELKEI